MKIKEFFIKRYGPLKDKDYVLSNKNNFNLVWGKNEDGKTLTIDALVKLLLGKNIKDFEHIDRVDENPGNYGSYVSIEDDKGGEIKLPGKEVFEEITRLTPTECHNIFIIRNSDLSITNENEFYTKLTGLRTKELSKIKEAIIEIGKTTPDGRIRNIKGEKLGERIATAQDLITKIDELAKKIKEEKFDEFEQELVAHIEAIENVTQRINNLEDARKRKHYEKGKEVLDKLKETLEKLKNLEIYNEDDEQLWRDCERDIKRYISEKEELIIELKESDEELKRINEKLIEKKRDFQVFDERKGKLDNEIKPELKNYEIKKGELILKEEKAKFFTLTGIISSILLGISLLGVIANPSSLFYTLIILFSASTIVSWIYKFQFVKAKARLSEKFENINLALSRFELNGENIQRILSNVQKVEEDFCKKEEELKSLENEMTIVVKSIEKLKGNTIPEVENKIKGLGDKINGLKKKSGEEFLQQYSEKLKLKQGYVELIGQQEAVLKSRFGAKDKTLEKNISYWDGEIKDLEEYKDKANDIEYNEKIDSKLKEEKRSREERQSELKDKINNLQRRLGEMEREVNKIIQSEADFLHCKTSVDLDAVRSRLQEFIKESENNKDNALEAIKIFEEIEAEEKEKVSQLFGKDSPVSKYFHEITNGLYEEVTFNQETGNIEVRRKNGKILEAWQLLGGAYDQLYFSIRLAFGEKLLKGKKGFFIMDDPFVKADPDRLKRQIGMLKRISELGWQVIYFSAKGEIKSALQEDIKEGSINYVEIQNIFS